MLYYACKVYISTDTHRKLSEENYYTACNYTYIFHSQDFVCLLCKLKLVGYQDNKFVFQNIRDAPTQSRK